MMPRLGLFLLLSLPLLAQTPENTASASMQRRLQGLKLPGLPTLDGKAPAQPTRRLIRVTRSEPCAIPMASPSLVITRNGSAMPEVTPPESAVANSELIVPRVCSL